MEKINESHSYDKEKGILYLNEKEMYLTKNENLLFRTLFASFDTNVSYDVLEFDEAKRKLVTSNLNLKLKGLIVRNIKDKNSLLLTFK